MTRVTLLITLALFAFVPASAAGPFKVLHAPDTFWQSYIDDLECNATAGCPYWDGNSWDTTSDADDPNVPHDHANIGSLLEGYMPVTNLENIGLGADAPGNIIKFLTHDDLSAPEYFAFENQNGPATYTLKMLAEITGYREFNEFGWAPVDNPDDPGARHAIFTGADGRSDTWTGELPARFFFYFSDTSRNVFYSSLNSRQFSLFKASGTFYIGFEDKTGPISPVYGDNVTDYDYNDMIVRLSAEPVPEPATLVLLGGGLLGLGLAARRPMRRR